MIGRTNCGAGGGGRAAVTINAPKNSTVSWMGTESGSVSMGSLTQANVTMKPGTYSFVCKLTVNGAETTIFSKTAAVTKGAVVNLYPDGALYWYGMTLRELTASGDAVPTITYNANSLRIEASPRGSGLYYSYARAEMDVTSYGSLHCIGVNGDRNNWEFGVDTTSQSIPSTYGEATMDISSQTGSKAVGLIGYVSNPGAAWTYNADVYALWLE